MAINWYTTQEVAGLFSHAPERESQEDWMSYAVCLGDGLRLWLTLDTVLLTSLLISFAVGLSANFVALLGLIFVGAPLVMVFGYLLGAIQRGYNVSAVLARAVQRLVC